MRRKYWEFGIEQAIYDKQRPGRSSKLKPEDHQAFKQRIIEEQEKREGGRLTAEDIHTIAAQEFNAHYKHSSSLYPLLHRIGMSWITARSRHPQADPEAQDAFKKTLLTKRKPYCLNTSSPNKSTFGFKTKAASDNKTVSPAYGTKREKGLALFANHDAKVWCGGLWRERKFCRWRRMRKRLAAVSCFASSSAAAGRLCSRLGAGRFMRRIAVAGSGGYRCVHVI